MMSNTDWQVLLLVLGALAFFVAVVIPEPHRLSPYRLRIIAAGLLFWIVTVILLAAKVL